MHVYLFLLIATIHLNTSWSQAGKLGECLDQSFAKLHCEEYLSTSIVLCCDHSNRIQELSHRCVFCWLGRNGSAH